MAESVKLQIDIRRFRKITASDKLIAYAVGVNNRYYAYIQDKKGEKYLLPTMSDKEFKKLNK